LVIKVVRAVLLVVGIARAERYRQRNADRRLREIIVDLAEWRTAYMTRIAPEIVAPAAGP